MRSVSSLLVLVAAICLSGTRAFAPRSPSVGRPLLDTAATSVTTWNANPVPVAAAAAALVTANILPFVALAEEDDYVYGAVDAPPLIPIIGGILAILTAALPVLLRSGEEAFEEMKDSDGFGSGRDQLGKRK